MHRRHDHRVDYVAWIIGLCNGAVPEISELQTIQFGFDRLHSREGGGQKNVLSFGQKQIMGQNSDTVFGMIDMQSGGALMVGYPSDGSCLLLSFQFLSMIRKEAHYETDDRSQRKCADVRCTIDRHMNRRFVPERNY
jgi:hypothetical protein